MDERQSPHSREAILDVLSEMLAVAREGRRLYREGVSEAPADLRDRFEEYGQESDRHVVLLEAAIRELGGDPSHSSPQADLVRGVSDFVLGETGASPRRWFYRLEALLVYEVRDAIIGEVLDRIADATDDPEVRDVLGRTALTVRSSEALGAHDVSRPSERIEWLGQTMRTVVLAEFGLTPPTRWDKLFRGY